MCRTHHNASIILHVYPHLVYGAVGAYGW